MVMQTTKIFQILQYFSKYEQNRLRKFLNSPYFNADENLSLLYEELINFINSGSEKDLKKETVWSKLKKEKYDDLRFRKYCSDLLKLCEQFLAQEVYQENPLYQATYLIEAISRKKIEKLYNSAMASARNLSEKQEYRPASFYYYQYEIEKLYYDLTESELRRASKSNVEAIANYLDYFYIAEKLKYYCSVLGQQYFISHEYGLLFIDEILEHLKKKQYLDIPPIAIYYQIYLTQTSEDEKDENYYALKELLKKHANLFPKREALSMFYSAINYSIRKLNRQKGNPYYLNELFDVYKSLIETEIIFVEGELSPWDFKNIVSTGINVKKFTWTEQFIDKYAQRIPSTYQKNAVTFNKAQLYFYQKKFEKVIELLREVEYDDITYDINSRSFLVMTYFEMDEIEPLFSLIESFRVYLNRHKNIPAERRRYTIQFLKFVKQIANTNPRDKKRLSKLKAEIEMSQHVSGKTWLLEKISEIA
jgi:hypothetical protein